MAVLGWRGATALIRPLMMNIRNTAQARPSAQRAECSQSWQG
jgi:hypothetical protein